MAISLAKRQMLEFLSLSLWLCFPGVTIGTEVIESIFAHLRQLSIIEQEERLEIVEDSEPNLATCRSFVELGEYEKAMQILSQLLEKEESQYWRTIYSNRVRILEDVIESGMMTSKHFEEFFFDGDIAALRGRATTILMYLEYDDLSYLEKCKRVRPWIGLVPDYNYRVEVDYLLEMSDMKSASRNERASWLLEAGNMCYERSDFRASEKYWNAVIRRFSDTPSAPKANFNLGLKYQREGVWKKAIKRFDLVIHSAADDYEQGSHLMQAYRNYRPRSQWEIARTHYLKGDYRAALNSYLVAKNQYPFQSWCGNAQVAYAYNYEYYLGLCYERLRNEREAAKRYFSASSMIGGLHFDPKAPVGLYKLYHSVGDATLLFSILDEYKSAWLDDAKDRSYSSVTEHDLLEMSPVQSIDNIVNLLFAINKQAESRDWRGLIDRLIVEERITRHSAEFPMASSNHSWWKLEVAKLLAENSIESLPLVLDEVHPVLDQCQRLRGYLESVSNPIVSREEKTRLWGLINEERRRARVEAKSRRWLFLALGLCDSEVSWPLIEAAVKSGVDQFLGDDLYYLVAMHGSKGLRLARRLDKLDEFEDEVPWRVEAVMKYQHYSGKKERSSDFLSSAKLPLTYSEIVDQEK